jgi:hypothetical protein
LELTIGLPDDVPLASGGRDLDNYLLPVAQRIGANQVVAAFGRKIWGRSSFAISSAKPAIDRVDAAFTTTTMTGSSLPACSLYRLDRSGSPLRSPLDGRTPGRTCGNH